jgi:predicted nucleic acid-binding protein
VTTNYVALETVAALQRRFGLTVVSRFVGDVLPAVSLEWVADDDHAAGLALLLGERRRKLSWVDCVSFVVMRRLNIGVAFSLDPHFAQQGFELVPEDFLSEGSATAPG